MTQKILITGTSGGFGRLTALTLLKAGHTVVGTMRNLGGQNVHVARELKTAGAHLVELDVTDDASVNAGVAKAIQLAEGLDVVINNAGVGVVGLQEAFTADDWRKVFEVNVFGVQRVNRAALPLLREQGSGLLLHVSSILGRMTVPFMGPYNASKWALEALAENYRSELSGLGIETCIVEPGAFATNFFSGLLQPSDHSRDASYGAMLDAPKQSIVDFENAMASNPAQSPQDVADAIAGLVATPIGQRQFRTVVDKMGMGDRVVPYNEAAESMTRAVYNALGNADMLTVKV